MKRIIGYVNTADLNHMREEDVRALTVINIAFGLIRDGEVVWDAKDARDGIVSIRKSNPELKIVLSVGGWGADGFSQAARTKEGRERFAASALAIVKGHRRKRKRNPGVQEAAAHGNSFCRRNPPRK